MREVLERAIKKAIDCGFIAANTLLPFQVFGKNEVGTYVCKTSKGEWCNIEGIIYNQDFAKSIWGDLETVFKHNDSVIKDIPWKFHLRNMVVSDDPIKYLGEHLDG